MNNKDLIDKLQDYLLTQSPQDVARIAANAMIDLGRFWDINDLDENEKNCFLERMAHNVNQLKKFAQDLGYDQPLKLEDVKRLDNDERYL